MEDRSSVILIRVTELKLSYRLADMRSFRREGHNRVLADNEQSSLRLLAIRCIVLDYYLQVVCLACLQG